MSTEKSLYGKGRAAVMCVALAIVSVVSIRSAMAQTEAAIFKLTDADGAEPLGGLIADSAGNLYGATSAGGPGRVWYGIRAFAVRVRSRMDHHYFVCVPGRGVFHWSTGDGQIGESLRHDDLWK